MIRTAKPDDVPAIHALVKELAAYEREPDAVVATEAMFSDVLFGDDHPASAPRTFCHVADVDGEVVGIALWFVSFSTWQGRHGIYLEDLFVRPEHRGAGHGQALLGTLAAVCVERGYGRLEWSVLDWNTPAIDFYRSLGAEPLGEWTKHRLSGEALDRAAALADR